MKVKLNDRFTLVCDSLTNKYLLEIATSEKSGDEYERVYCGYHIQFRHLLKHYYLKRLAEVDEMENITEEERKRRNDEDWEIISALDAMKKIEGEVLELAESIGDKLQEQHRKMEGKK